MPAYTVGQSLVDPSSDLTDGTKYVVQNQGTSVVYFAVGTAAFTTAPADALILGPLNSTGTPSHLEFTYASATDHVRMWAHQENPGRVVFHALG